MLGILFISNRTCGRWRFAESRGVERAESHRHEGTGTRAESHSVTVEASM